MKFLHLGYTFHALFLTCRNTSYHLSCAFCKSVATSFGGAFGVEILTSPCWLTERVVRTLNYVCYTGHCILVLLDSWTLKVIVSRVLVPIDHILKLAKESASMLCCDVVSFHCGGLKTEAWGSTLGGLCDFCCLVHWYLPNGLSFVSKASGNHV